VRHDMQAKGIRQHLWLKLHLNNQHKILKRHASYVLPSNDLNIFLSRMGELKLPTDHVVDRKLGSMKSHDFHIVM
jgi:hypothetical protein